MWHKEFRVMVKFTILILFFGELIILSSPFSLFSQSSDINSIQNELISKDIKDNIHSLVNQGNLPSLQFSVVSNDQIVCSEVYGKNSGKDLMYMIGSIQKVFNATAILQLYERGLLRLDNDINAYLPFIVRHPKYPEVPITIGMLLSHRSGLGMFKHQVEWDTRFLNFKKDSTSGTMPEVAFLSQEEFIRASLDSLGLNYDPAAWHFKPGTNYFYSISAQYILCYLIEKVSGQTYSDYMHQNIFEPLEMKNTMFYKDDSLANFATPYCRNDKENIELPSWAGERDFIYSTADDLGKFMIAHMNNGHYKKFQLLERETIELMQEKHSPGKDLFHLESNCPYKGYGYGIIQYSNNWYGHGGSTFGYQCLWSFNKSNNNGYVIVTNLNGILYAGENYKSAWTAVSSVEKVIKSEIAPHNNKLYFIIVILLGVLFLITILIKRSIKKRNNYAT